ncbi:MAG TPA: hypothetical protein VGJ07_04470 [Rugosimonospora sp.]
MTTDDDPPVPAGAVNFADLTGRLRTLWTWAGRPSEAALRSLIRMRRTASGFVVEGMPSGTVERVLAGDEPAWESVEPFVASCLRVGSRSQERIDLDVAAWHEAWRRVAPPSPVGSGTVAGPARTGPRRWASLLVRQLTGSPAATLADDRHRDLSVRGRPSEHPPAIPAWRPALIAAAAVAVLFMLGAWAVVDSGGHHSGPRPVPATSRSATPPGSRPPENSPSGSAGSGSPGSGSAASGSAVPGGGQR